MSRPLVAGLAALCLAIASAARSAPAPQAIEPIDGLLSHADVAAGEKTGRVCLTCHNVAKGGGTVIGPNLWNVVGRPHAAVPGFTYSAALKATQARSWTYDELNHWLYSPQAYAPGTFMGFPGLKKDQDRADVIAWLRTLSDHPQPLPNSR